MFSGVQKDQWHSSGLIKAKEVGDMFIGLPSVLKWFVKNISHSSQLQDLKIEDREVVTNKFTPFTLVVNFGSVLIISTKYRNHTVEVSDLLTLSRQRPLSYRNQFIDLRSKGVNIFWIKCCYFRNVVLQLQIRRLLFNLLAHSALITQKYEPLESVNQCYIFTVSFKAFPKK